MPKYVYNNVEGLRVLDGGQVCEDVTSVGLPTVSHPTTTISAPGMVMDIDIPNETHVEAMELSIAHNNGENCVLLATPGIHKIEVRSVRQRYNTAKSVMEHKPVKWYIHGSYKSSEKGSVEMGNPLGTTTKYAVTYFEEVFDGKTVTKIGIGEISVNGKNFTDVVENLLK